MDEIGVYQALGSSNLRPRDKLSTITLSWHNAGSSIYFRHVGAIALGLVGSFRLPNFAMPAVRPIPGVRGPVLSGLAPI
jgi:hypothetical protein